jgi:hypothetical protein
MEKMNNNKNRRKSRSENYWTRKKSGLGKSRTGKENERNRGFEEDQPGNPLRASNATPKEQQGRNYTPDTYDN